MVNPANGRGESWEGEETQESAGVLSGDSVCWYDDCCLEWIFYSSWSSHLTPSAGAHSHSLEGGINFFVRIEINSHEIHK